MVNYGVSRGCGTCRRRRKKCDEGRPCCQRCIKANISCEGYRDEAHLVFRPFSGSTDAATAAPQAGLNGYRPDGRPRASLPSDVDLEQHAIACFIEDYCLTPKDPSSSRGYLVGLERLLAEVGLSSDVGKAASAAALASLANKTQDTRLADQASIVYSGLLSSFQVTMANTTTANSVESLTAAVLMGLYEIISASRHRHGNHGAHVQGVSAILSKKNSPLSRHPAMEAMPEARAESEPSPLGLPLQWPHHLGILCPPSANSVAKNLDSLLVGYTSVFRHHVLLSPNVSKSTDDIRQLQEYAMSIDEELKTWPNTQPRQWQANTIGYSMQQDGGHILPWHGRVDLYLDVYISGLWNSYRKCRLVLLNIVNTCAERLREMGAMCCPNYSEHFVRREVQSLVEDFSASIPFHLLEDPAALTAGPKQNDLLSSDQTRNKLNKAVGGLLLIHPLHTLANLSVVSMQGREMFRKTLAWIGHEMCIGQAAVLANPSPLLPTQYVVDGHVIIWLGTLVPGAG